jgi:hypothetical protein
MPSQKSNPLLGWQSPSKNYILNGTVKKTKTKLFFWKIFDELFLWNFLDAVRNGLRW